MKRVPADDLSRTGPSAAGVPARGATDEFLPVVYDQLLRLAQHMMATEPAGHTLQATALVHEAFLRLSDAERQRWKNRNHFYLVAAKAMRHILVDRARARGRLKRGGDHIRVDLTDADRGVDEDSFDLLNLDQALRRLAERDARAAQVVILRFFGGLTMEEAAEALEISPATAKRDWLYAKAWLHLALEAPEP